MGTEISRKLASIQKITDIRPIDGADAIEVATVLGWDIVVKKDEFKVGDLAVYFEIDSFLPRRPEWEFLEKSSLRKMGDKEGLRLRTIKLRGQISQGLLISIDTLFDKMVSIQTYQPLYQLKNGCECFYHEDLQDAIAKGETFDLTEILGVVKWEPPLPANLGGVARGNFPSFLRKTDQERIQNCFRTLMNRWLGHEWEVTVKMDGSSFTAYYVAETDTFGICSRNLDLVEQEGNAFWDYAHRVGLKEKMRALGRSIAIQGELCGPGIQKNHEKLDTNMMFVFDVFDINTSSYLSSYARYLIVSELELDHVPILCDEWYFPVDTQLSEILAEAEGPSYVAAVSREGVVYKSKTDPNVSFKAISNSYLLKEKD